MIYRGYLTREPSCCSLFAAAPAEIAAHRRKLCEKCEDLQHSKDLRRFERPQTVLNLLQMDRKQRPMPDTSANPNATPRRNYTKIN